MRRHPIPSALSLLALVALPCGLLGGCGGGNVGGAVTTRAGASTTAATTATATTTQPPTTASTTTTPRSGASAARAALSAQYYTPRKRRFAAAPIDSSSASQLARRGSIVVPVAVGGPGKVSAFGQAELGTRGLIVRVAEAAPRVVHRAGVVHLTLTLTPAARARLAAGRGILMYVAVKFSKGQVVQRLTVPLAP